MILMGLYLRDESQDRRRLYSSSAMAVDRDIVFSGQIEHTVEDERARAPKTSVGKGDPEIASIP